MNKRNIISLFVGGLSLVALSIDAHADSIKINVPPADQSMYSEGRESRWVYCGVVDGKKRDDENRPLFVQVVKVEVPREQVSVEIERDKIPAGPIVYPIPQADGTIAPGAMGQNSRGRLEKGEGFFCLYNRQWEGRSISFIGLSVEQNVKEITFKSVDNRDVKQVIY
jgi:hypothetical protein